MDTDDRIETEIDALLARDDAASVVDALLSMPPRAPASEGDPRGEKTVNARLQARLAHRMRQVLEGGEPEGAEDGARRNPGEVETGFPFATG